MKSTGTKNTRTAVEKAIFLLDRLRSVGTSEEIGGVRVFTYQSGWDDARVAQEASAESGLVFTHGAVKDFRHEGFGAINWSRGSVTSQQATLARFEEIERRLAALENS